MTKVPTSIEDWLTSSVAGSLVAQIANYRGIDLTQSDAPEQLQRLGLELAELSIDPRLVAQHGLMALATLFMEDANSKAIIDAYTSVLWSVLGDPVRNGDNPPEIYRRAAFALYVAFLGFFDRSIPEKVFDPSQQ